MTVRTRFAPSPTGYLHIGGARTALFSWLFARRNNGVFILRIEDTDLERSTPESVLAILEGMSWLGLNHDEGPFYQTQHFDRYRQVVQQLLTEEKAYRCNCSKERLENLRHDQMAAKQKPRYDGHCRELNLSTSEQPYVVRFRNPTEGEVVFEDAVFGRVSFQNNELDDLIIARSDGTPTYNFTVVVDDWDMKITHVIRGDDHINNTPRQINILKALGAELPVYAHVPMILGADGKRLSKRHGAVSVMQYREEGYLPEALLNYLIRLGWSHGDQEIFSRQEMIHYFDLSAINKAPAAVNPEKLLWLNQHYLKNNPPEQTANELAWHFAKRNLNPLNGPDLKILIPAQAERVKTLLEMTEKSRFFYEDHITFNPVAVAKNLTPAALPILTALQDGFQQLSQWQAADIHAVIASTVEKLGLGFGKVAQPLRVVVTGDTISPAIDLTLELLGKTKVIQRLEYAKTII